MARPGEVFSPSNDATTPPAVIRTVVDRSAGTEPELRPESTFEFLFACGRGSVSGPPGVGGRRETLLPPALGRRGAAGVGSERLAGGDRLTGRGQGIDAEDRTGVERGWRRRRS